MAQVNTYDGTVAERYLRQTRGLDIPDDLSGVLRFHSQCTFGPGVRRPCLVALFRDIVSNEPCAIHRSRSVQTQPGWTA